jgi:DNA-binding transcriptional LysR family regulator
MRLRLLTTFLAVSRTLNVTRASEVLHLSQSGVSEQIQALEESLDAQLFVRKDRKLELTPAGVALLPYAKQILDLAEEARQLIRASATALGGKLRIGGLETLCSQYLPELIARFAASFPAVEIELTTEGSQPLRSATASGEIDAAFAFGKAGIPDSCAAVVLRREPLIIVCGPEHPLRQATSVSFAQLAQERFLVTRPGCVYRGFFDSAFSSRMLPTPVIFGEFESIGLVRKLVASGAGCALVPEIAVSEELASGALHALPLAEALGSAELVLLWRENRASLPVLRAFLDFVCSYASAQTSR